jgi:putative adenylate-forming enzyme
MERARVILLAALKAFFHAVLFQPRNHSVLQRRIERNKKMLLRRLPKIKFYRNRKISLWTDIPKTDRKTLVENFSQLNVLNLSNEDAITFIRQTEQEKSYKKKYKGYTLGPSSGTSGRRVAFIASDWEIGLWVGWVFGKILGWRIFRRQRIAFVFRNNGPLYEGLGFLWTRFRFFDINTDVAAIHEELKEFQPTILISIPNFFHLYTRAFPKPEISPHMVISSADVLDSHEREKLAKYFGIPVTQTYQAFEGFLGYTCQEGQIHLNEEHYCFEKEFVSEDTFTPIITDFARRSQTLVRYRMDDLLKCGINPCPCGLVTYAIAKVDGRLDHRLTFQQPDRKSIEIFPDQLRQLIGQDDFYDQNYQFLQVSEDELHCGLDRKLSPELEDKLKNLISHELEKKGGHWIRVRIVTGQNFLTSAGKRLRIVKYEYHP